MRIRRTCGGLPTRMHPVSRTYNVRCTTEGAGHMSCRISEGHDETALDPTPTLNVTLSSSPNFLSGSFTFLLFFLSFPISGVPCLVSSLGLIGENGQIGRFEIVTRSLLLTESDVPLHVWLYYWNCPSLR